MFGRCLDILIASQFTRKSIIETRGRDGRHRSMGKVENSLLDSLKDAGGEAYQSELVRQTGFSRSRVSEVLSVLERNGLVSRFPLGKNFRVVSRTLSSRRKVRRSQETENKNGLRLGFIRAAEYPFVILFKRLLRENLGITLDLKSTKMASIARDLSLLRLDLGISPVLTHFMYHAMGAPFKIVAPAGSWGISIVVRSKNGRRNTKSSRPGYDHYETINDGTLAKIFDK